MAAILKNHHWAGDSVQNIEILLLYNVFFLVSKFTKPSHINHWAKKGDGQSWACHGGLKPKRREKQTKIIISPVTLHTHATEK